MEKFNMRNRCHRISPVPAIAPRGKFTRNTGLFRLDLRPRRLIVSVGEGPVRAGAGIKELRLK